MKLKVDGGGHLLVGVHNHANERERIRVSQFKAYLRSKAQNSSGDLIAHYREAIALPQFVSVNIPYKEIERTLQRSRGNFRPNLPHTIDELVECFAYYPRLR